jgi:ABC-type branched-subunit amino acid transport system ATPase component
LNLDWAALLSKVSSLSVLINPGLTATTRTSSFKLLASSALILVEQNARLGLMLASYGYVLENGEMSLQGKTSDLLKNEDVKKAYLGV